MLGWDNPVTPFPGWDRQDPLVLMMLGFLGLGLGAVPQPQACLSFPSASDLKASSGIFSLHHSFHLAASLLQPALTQVGNSCIFRLF